MSSLLEELEATLDVLGDDVARRRWGRALTYFLETLSPDEGPAVASVSRDVLNMLLPGKDGLRTNAAKVSPAVVVQVGKLEERCRQILRDGPVRAFGIGLVQGGQSPQSDEVHAFWKVVRGAEDHAGADLTISPVLQIAGRIWAPSEPYGLGTGRLRIDQRIASMNVGVPPDLTEPDLRDFLIRVLTDAVAWSQTAVIRKKLSWSLDANRNLIARVTAEFRNADPR